MEPSEHPRLHGDSGSERHTQRDALEVYGTTVIANTVIPPHQNELRRLDQIGWPLVLRSSESIAASLSRPWNTPWHDADSQTLFFLHEFGMDFKVISENLQLDRLEDQCHQQYEVLVASMVLASKPLVKELHNAIMGNLTS
jgi:hypothetical protein